MAKELYLIPGVILLIIGFLYIYKADEIRKTKFWIPSIIFYIFVMGKGIEYTLIGWSKVIYGI